MQGFFFRPVCSSKAEGFALATLTLVRERHAVVPSVGPAQPQKGRKQPTKMWQVWLGLVVTASVTSEQDLPDFAAPPSAPLAVQPSLEARVRRVGRGFAQRCFSATLHRLPNNCAPICFGGWPACLLRVGMLDCATSRLLSPASGRIRALDVCAGPSYHRPHRPPLAHAAQRDGSDAHRMRSDVRLITYLPALPASFRSSA